MCAMLNFNAAQVAPQQSFEALPAGWYNMMVTESEMRPTKDGQNQYLRLTLKVIDGEHANRQTWDNLNIHHNNPVVTEIAYRQLSAYCHATGQIQLQDSQQLHGIPMKVRLSVRPATEQYEASNDVKEVKNANDPTAGGTGAPQQGMPQQPQQPAAPVGQQPPFQQQPAQPQQPVQQPPVQNAAAPQQQASPQVDPSSAQTATTSPSDQPWQQQAPQPMQNPPQQPQQSQMQPATQQGGATPPWAP